MRIHTEKDAFLLIFERALGGAVVLAGITALLFSTACEESIISSQIIEFCTPLAHTETHDPDSPPLVATVLNPQDEPPIGEEALVFLIGTEFPLTTIDASTYAEIFDESEIEVTDNYLETMDAAIVDNRSALPDPGQSPVMGRAIFTDFSAFVTRIPSLGPGENTAFYKGVLGGDLLRRYAVRIHYGSDPECILPWAPEERFSTITFIQEYADDNKDLAGDGFSVLSFSLAGGGRMLFNNKTVSFGATRVTVSGCVEAEPFSPELLDPGSAGIKNLDDLETKIPTSGQNAVFLVATGTIPLVLGDGFFAGLRAAGSETSREYPTTSTTLNLMEGQVPAESTTLNRVALVGSVSDDMSPCQELALRRRIAWIRYWLPQHQWTQEVLKINKLGAPVAEYDAERDPETTHEPLSAYIISDTTELFEGLRFETAQQIPGIDGIIGHNFLKHFEIIVDYPGERVVFRCRNYRPPNQNNCPTPETLGANTCCESSGRCVCPSAQPCCQFPFTKKP